MRVAAMLGTAWILASFSLKARAEAAPPAAPPGGAPGATAAGAVPSAQQPSAGAPSAAPSVTAAGDAAHPAQAAPSEQLPPAPPPANQPAPQPPPASSTDASPSVGLSLSALNAPRAVDRPDAPSASLAPRHYDAWPLLIDARYGINSRLSGAFEGAQEDLLDSAYALGASMMFSPEIAGTFELEHAGLGRVIALDGQSSVNAAYGATSGWVGLRAFPWRNERIDLFLGIRAGLAFQNVSAVGTRQNGLFTAPAVPFKCSAGGDPGFAIAGGLGMIYRLSPHLSVVSRVDGEGYRLSGDALGSCAVGIGAVTTANVTVGVGYEFETIADAKRTARR